MLARQGSHGAEQFQDGGLYILEEEVAVFGLQLHLVRVGVRAGRKYFASRSWYNSSARIWRLGTEVTSICFVNLITYHYTVPTGRLTNYRQRGRRVMQRVILWNE
jgi:hypothetical protein